MPSTTFTIIGLVCDMIGASTLGYELLFGYPKHNRARTEQLRLDHLDKFIADMIHRIEILPSPPYTDQDKTQLIQEFNVQWTPQREKRAEAVSHLTEGHKEVSYLAGWFGLLMLLFGFGLQIAGTLAT